jgi:hypothetical protein
MIVRTFVIGAGAAHALARVLIDLARGGERVFAVCGSSHAVKLEPALRATFGSALRTDPW